MKKFLFILIILISLLFPLSNKVSAEEATEEITQSSYQALPMDFYYAEVDKVREKDYMENTFIQVTLLIKQEGEEDKKVKVDLTPDQLVFKKYHIETGDKLIVRCFEQGGEEYCDIVDTQRKTQLIWLIIFFIAIIIVIGRWKGLSSLIYLSVSVGVVLFFIIPRIITGANILHTTMIGVWCFILPSTFIAHGFTKKTLIAVVSMFFSTILIWLLSFYFIEWSKIFGATSEELFRFVTMSNNQIDLRGLLLAGILIGALGLVDDVCYAQVASTYEINRANPKYSWRELYASVMKIGRHHIISITNTLFLAYVSVSLSTILMIFTYAIPAEIAVQREMIATEIVRAIIGTGVVVMIIPLTTIMAVFYLKLFGSRSAIESKSKLKSFKFQK